MLSQKWGDKSKKSNPINFLSQPVTKPTRTIKNLPLTSDPILPINRERIALQINYEKENFPAQLFALPIKKGKEFDTLQCLHKTYETYKIQNDNLLFSATYIPYYPDHVLIESSDRNSCISFIMSSITLDRNKTIFLNDCIENLSELNDTDIFNYFCYPIQFLSLYIGSIVRIKDPEFQNEPAQIVNVNCDTGKIMVKMYGHIDYDNLIQFNFTSQKALNSKMPNNYRPNPAPFDENFFARHNAKIEIKSVNISMAPGGVTDMIFWDGNYYYDKFMYIEFPIKNINTQNLNITEAEFQRFQDSHVSWEIINNSFIEHMNRTVVVRPNLEITQSSQININNNTIFRPIKAKNFTHIEQSQPILIQNEIIADSPPLSAHTSPPPSLPESPSPSPPPKESTKVKKGKKKVANITETKEKTKKKAEKSKDKERHSEKNKDRSKDTESDEDISFEKVERNKLAKPINQTDIKNLTIGSTGLIIKRNLPCTVVNILNSGIVVDPDPITIGGTYKAFRELGQVELSQIERNKSELKQRKVDKNNSKAVQASFDDFSPELPQEEKKHEKRNKRKKSVHSILSESESDSYDDYYYSEEYEEEPKKAKKKAKKETNSANSNTKTLPIAIQKDPPSLREFDLVEMTNGQIGAITKRQDSFKLNVHLTTNEIIEDIQESDVDKIIPDQGYVTDNSGQQICLNDKVFGSHNQPKIVIRMHNRKLFVQDLNTSSKSFEWIDADEALSTYISANFSVESENSVIGKNVHRITNGISSKPFKIEAVSKKGYLMASGHIKFKFKDQGKNWDFDH